MVESSIAPGALLTARVGDTLPELAIPITTTLIVTGAIASRDFQAVHHDRAAAQERNLSDIIMNIYTTSGLVSRYVTAWAGPSAELKRITFRLGVPNYPGDTMRLSGTIAGVEDGPPRTVEITVQGQNSRGTHVSGNVTLAVTNSPATHTSSEGQ